MIDKRLIGFSTIDFYTSPLMYGIDVVKRDLLNEFMTPLGSRKGLPTFGSIAWRLIFETMTDANKELLEKDCIKIINSDPRVKLESINLDEVENGIVAQLQLTYIPSNLLFDLYVDFKQENAEG